MPLQAGDLFVLGFNHRTVGIEDRSSIAISDSLRARIYADSRAERLDSLCILNTCNRTELYGIGDPAEAVSLLNDYVPATKELVSFMQQKSGPEAVEYLFHVASGLDSQIVGDFEILEQFKKAFKASREHGHLSGFMERLANTCLQAAKEIRNSTRLSSGTTSFSYAVVNVLREIELHAHSKVLVVGLGEIGQAVARNMQSYFPQYELSVANRSESKASALAAEIGAKVLAFGQVSAQWAKYDVVITATGHDKGYLLSGNHFATDTTKALIDLSVPAVIDPNLGAQSGIWHYSLDQISELINQTMAERRAEIPAAEKIVHKHVHEFLEWSKLFAKGDVIRKWKDMVAEVSGKCPHFQTMEAEHRDKAMKKSIARFVLFLKENDIDVDRDQVLQAYLNSGEFQCDHKACGRRPGDAKGDCPICRVN